MKVIKTKLVSIVVPAYNVENYIYNCLSSVIDQTYSEIEVLVINDASTDRTYDAILEIIKKDARVKVIDLESNVGVHAARAKGIREARGDFIGFVDGDDRIAPEMVEILLESATENNADIAICGAEKVTESGVKLGSKVFFSKPFCQQANIFEDFCSRRFGSGVLWNKLYKAELIKKHGAIILDRKVDASEDYIVNVGCFSEAACVSVVSNFLYYYLLRSESASQGKNKAKHFVRIIDAYAECLKVYSNLTTSQKEEVTRLYSSQLCFNDYQVGSVDELYSYNDNLKESIISFSCRYPAGLYSLIHSFQKQENINASKVDKLKKHFKKILKSFYIKGV